jgi:hypothetical protein
LGAVTARNCWNSAPKRVIVGVDDPQMSASDAVATARRIGAPPPTYVPGRHLTMISSPQQVADAIRALPTTPAADARAGPT